MDLPIEIWVHIISEFFAEYCDQEKLWLRNVATLLRSSEDADLDLDLQLVSICARQKEVYYMAFHFVTFNKTFLAVMQSRQIWRYIFKCTMGSKEWRHRVPHEFEIRLGADYLAACKAFRTLTFPGERSSFIVGNNDVQQYVPSATKNLRKSCDRCQQARPHEHLVKFNGAAQKLVELQNWPDIHDKMQVINADRKYLVITSRDHIVLFDIDADRVVRKFSTEMLPRQFHLFFVNIYKRKLVFAMQGLGAWIQTLILDLDKGMSISPDDISFYVSWPDTPYYISKHPYNLRGGIHEIKILNDDNSFTTHEFDVSMEKNFFNILEKSVFIRFIDNRMLVWVENEGVYEVDPITRNILYTLPAFESIENRIFLGYRLMHIEMDPEERYTTITARHLYTGDLLGNFQFRSIFSEWNSLVNGEGLTEPWRVQPN